MTTKNDRPYLSAAVICEKVLQDKDGPISLIRIVDRITVTASISASSETVPPIPINLTAFISLKSGNARGKHIVKWRAETPSGAKLPEQLFPVLLEGEDRGVNLILNLAMLAEQEGIYWFDVLLEDQFLTRIPLRIIYQRLSQTI